MKAPFESLTGSDFNRNWNRSIRWAAYVLAAELICVALLTFAVSRARPVDLKTQVTRDAEIARAPVTAGSGACRYKPAKMQSL